MEKPEQFHLAWKWWDWSAFKKRCSLDFLLPTCSKMKVKLSSLNIHFSSIKEKIWLYNVLDLMFLLRFFAAFDKSFFFWLWKAMFNRTCAQLIYIFHRDLLRRVRIIENGKLDFKSLFILGYGSKKYNAESIKKALNKSFAPIKSMVICSYILGSKQ